MRNDAVCEVLKQAIKGNENTQIGGDLLQNNIQIFVVDKQQLSEVLESVLERSPEMVRLLTKHSTRKEKWRSFIAKIWEQTGLKMSPLKF